MVTAEITVVDGNGAGGGPEKRMSNRVTISSSRRDNAL
jgi:hypothetical protein